MTDTAMSKKVTGMSGGTAIGSNIAGEVNGTMTTQGSRSVHAQDIGNVLTGDNTSRSMTDSAGPRTSKNDANMSPAQLQEILKLHYCKETTLKQFSDNNIGGFMFKDLDDKMLDDLEIENKIERRRLLQIKKELYL